MQGLLSRAVALSLGILYSQLGQARDQTWERMSASWQKYHAHACANPHAFDMDHACDNAHASSNTCACGHAPTCAQAGTLIVLMVVCNLLMHICLLMNIQGDFFLSPTPPPPKFIKSKNL